MRKTWLLAVFSVGLPLIALRLQSPLTSRAEAQQGGNADAMRAADVIDKWIAAKWKEVNLKPTETSSDAEFLRRLYLDVGGVIPPANEAREFIESRDADKRRAAIDRLLNSPLYAENMATVWENRLLGRQFRAVQVDREGLHAWVKKAVADNMPYDQFARELIDASGTNDKNGAANYTLRFGMMGRGLSTEDMTNSVARIFMGTQIQCAQCHDHKTEAWKQTDFHSLAAFFARTRPVPTRRPTPEDRRPPIEVRDLPFGEQQMEVHSSGKKETVYPKFLEGPEYRGGESSRREALAKWITAKDNKWFGPAASNRVWEMFFGRGIVDPVDDIRPSNLPSHPELLKLMAEDFGAHNYDIKHLMRSVLYSQTYQLSSRSATEANPLQAMYFVKAPLRQMTPEQLFNSMFVATGLNENPFLRQRGDLDRIKQGLMRLFVLTFDTDEAEEHDGFDGTIPQALLLMNGDLANRGVAALPGSALGTILQAGMNDREKLNTMFLRVLGRFPTPSELNRLEPMIRSAGGGSAARTEAPQQPSRFVRTGFGGFGKAGPGKGGPFGGPPAQGARDPKSQAFEDIFWSLLNSSEFIFNH